MQPDQEIKHFITSANKIIVNYCIMHQEKIAIIEACNVTPHLETTLEIAKNHLDQGDIVNYYFIGKRLPFNDFLIQKIFSKWRKSPEEAGIRLISHKNLTFSGCKDFQVLSSLCIPNFKTLVELKQYKHKNFRAGIGCASSLISHLRLSDPDIEKNRKLIESILVSCISTYEYACSIFRREKPNMVYLFNGRFAINRAILEAAIECNIPYMIHERGSGKSKYELYPYMPQNCKLLGSDIEKKWNEANDWSRKTEIAKYFFYGQRNRVELGWKSFVSDQVRGKSIDIALGGRRLITYFSSSEDELASVDDCIDWGVWLNQMNAVRHLIEVVKQRPDLFLVIRLHPHMKHKHENELLPWLNLSRSENVMIVMPDDDIDSYALVDQSHVVISCGSTIGLEAVFWGVPSICLGPTYYANLNAVYLPKSAEELTELLSRSTLRVNSLAAMPYGYYMSTFGEYFKHYRAETLFRGKFLGDDLQEDLLSKCKKILLNFLRSNTGKQCLQNYF